MKKKSKKVEVKQKEGVKKGIIPFKCKDPKKAGIIAFLVMFLISAMLLGAILAVVFLSNPWNKSDVSSDGDDVNVVVTQEENLIVNVVKEVQSSVVSIAVSQLSFSNEEGLINESSNIGTGFVVDSSGIIVTNQHVVSKLDADYKVITSKGVEYDVVEIERDDNSDIAVLKVDATDLIPLKFGDSDAIVVGQTVIAIGTPLGEYMGSVTSGIVSGLDRDVTASSSWFGSSKTYENVIQTDAAVNPGNSGGPLLNTAGEVIGINFATTAGADNIAFALPINIVKSRVDEYRTYGKFIKPYLGVSYQMISEYQAIYYQDVVAGALVVRTDPYGPAHSVGIVRGDIVIEFGGEKVEGSFSAMISEHEVGEEIEMKLWNEGEERVVSVTLVELE
ncbi:trypsin-like peptidase domain-containing protein [bacterium]|nr:trypsin-like peptidase domain-containing protein [bacterium]